MKSFITCVFCFTSFFAIAQKNNFDASLIADSLKKNADAVVRLENKVFEVTKMDRATYKEQQVITILSEKGNKYLNFKEYSSDFIKLEDASVIVYDGSGKIIEKYKKKQMQSFAIGDGLVPSGTITYMSVVTNTYPITIEINYELLFKGTLNFPTFYLAKPLLSIEQANYKVIVDNNDDIRYKAKNTLAKPLITTEGTNKVYTWNVVNQVALCKEEGTTSYESIYPTITLAPNKFKLDDYDGDMSSWKSFGKWYGTLKKDLDILPETCIAYLQKITTGAITEKEKIKIVYKYLQENFRYVSIQLGIGGYKPFAANFTNDKKYGDCKALSNYMQACLKAIGIKSYQALINAGYDEAAVDSDFPSNQFNHVIVCVPNNKDTVWLECTSKTNDFGVLGNFTENKNALLITEDGGELIKTPISKSKENVYTSNSKVRLNSDLENIQYTIVPTGEFKQEAMHYLLDQTKSIQTKYIINNLGIKQPDDFTIITNPVKDSFSSTINMTKQKLQEFNAGNKYFYNPRVSKIWDEDLPTTENRKQDYLFEFPFIKKDTTIYTLANAFLVESLPKNKAIQFTYGNFATTYTYDEKNKQIITTATLVLNEYKIPAKKYEECTLFFDKVKQEYNEKIVLIKL
jgi:transglutaminase-like putative cysteine protease